MKEPCIICNAEARANLPDGAREITEEVVIDCPPDTIAGIPCWNCFGSGFTGDGDVKEKARRAYRSLTEDEWMNFLNCSNLTDTGGPNTMRGPWFITPEAVRDYLEIRGWTDDTDGPNFEAARNDLIEMAREIVASGKEGKPTEQGHLRYRTGRARGRMGLVVSSIPRVEGDLPQLVAVTRSMN